MEEADRHCLGPGHPVEVGGLKADKVDVFSGDLLLDLLHVGNEPLISNTINSVVICGTEYEISEKKHLISNREFNFKCFVSCSWKEKTNMKPSFYFRMSETLLWRQDQISPICIQFSFTSGLSTAGQIDLRS